MSNKQIKEAYALLDSSEQWKIQEMYTYYEKVYKIGDELSEEGQMVFDMIMSMTWEELEENMEEIKPEGWETEDIDSDKLEWSAADILEKLF